MSQPSENQEAIWCDLNDAIPLVYFDNTRAILRRARRYLQASCVGGISKSAGRPINTTNSVLNMMKGALVSNEQSGGNLPPKRPINLEINVAPYPTPVPAPPPLPAAPEDGRTSKQMTLAEAIERYVPDGVESLALGGMHLQNNPMALVRELIRQKKRIKSLITSPAASLSADLLIGAALVEEVITSYFGFEHLGLAPAYRRFCQEGRLKVHELDELTLLLALRAGAAGQPFAALPPSIALSDVVTATPHFYTPVQDPFTGKTVLAAPPLRPKVALVVCQQADKRGNAIFKGSTFTDREMILAAETTILQVEQIIPTSQVTRNPMPVTVPGCLVKAVVPAPFSCHPTACHRFYNYDEAHLKEYLELATTAEGFEAYLQKYVLNQGEVEYLGKTSLTRG
ncbi:MAG: CoA-transferase [Chloroflexota bacterium]